MFRSLALKAVVIAIVSLGSLALADDADTAEPFISEVRGGLLAHDVSGLWSGSHEESGADINLEVYFRRLEPQLLNGMLRPAIGASINNVGDTSHYYVDLIWERRFDSGFFFDIGLGLAWHDGEKEVIVDNSRKQLGTRINFHVPIDVGYSFRDRHRIALSFQHLSNAGIGDENEGLDTVGLRYCILF